jgi:hypothetical protein
VTKTTLTTSGFVERIDGDEGGCLKTLDNELRNPVTWANNERLVAVSVVQDDGDLSSVARVNEAGCVEAGDPMVQG